MLPLFHTVWTDLQVVDDILHKEFKLKTGSVSDLVELKLENMDYYLRPALLLAIAGAYGYRGERAVKVASVVQFIYLATKVHALVREDEDLDVKRGFQFPVLVGDYLYGQFFRYLCKADALEYLTPLSKVICDIHEGGVIRKQVEDGSGVYSEMEILEKEEAMLFAAACQVGAQLGGANERESELFWQFGRNLGLGVAALTRGLGDKLVGNAFSKARDFLTSLPAPIPPLSDIGSYFEGQVSKVHS